MIKMKTRKVDVKVNPKEARERLFAYLDAVLEISETKVLHKRGKDLNKIRYGRLLVSAIDSYGRLLRESELDDLIKRVERLEEKL
jgi:hypothetical protein